MNDPLGILNIDGINTKNELNKIYFYQYLGIISLKNGNYSISTYFFLKCFNLISIKYYPGICSRTPLACSVPTLHQGIDDYQ